MPTSTRAIGKTVFMIRCGKFAIAPRADRGVRPYKALYGFAENACNFAIACRRVDVGIDPYGRITLLPFIVRFCNCVLRGRGRTPPLRKIITSSLFTITYSLNSLLPYVTTKRGGGSEHTASDPFRHGCAAPPSRCGSVTAWV